MSEQEFEAYLRLMGRFLRLNSDQRETIGRELRGHMEDRMDELLARGYSREDAVNTILDEFGDAAALAGEFGRIGARRKWIMRTTVGTVGIAAGILFVSFLLPENRPLPSPSYSNAAPAVEAAEAAIEPGQQGADRGLLVGAGSESTADRETREKLGRTISIEFPEGTSFEEILNYLREQGGISISVNWNALAVRGIDRTTDTLGMSVKNARIDTILDMLLENIGGPEAQLGYAVIDGVVRISTAEQLDRNAIVRVYDVSDLIHRDLPAAVREALKQARAPQQPPMGGMMPGASPAEPPQGGGGFGGMGMGGMGGYGGGERSSRSSRDEPNTLDAVIRRLERDRVGDLQDLITRTIAPGTWQTVGSMSYYDGLLVVSQTTRVHQKLADLLATMRQALAARPSPATDPAGASAGGGFGPVAVAPMRGGFAPPASRPAGDGLGPSILREP